MVKNVKLKKMLKNSIFKVGTMVNKYIPKDEKKIMLYSANKGIEFNLKPLLSYMLEHKMHQRYDITCVVEHKRYMDDIEGVRYVTRVKGMLDFLTTKYVFYTTGQIPIKPSQDQKVIHLRHGNVYYKAIGKMSNINNGDELFFTHMVASSPFFVPIMAKEYGCNETQIMIAGEPMLDDICGYLNKGERDTHKNYKLLVWAPTFRQSDYLGYDDSSEECVPLFTETEYAELNSYLGTKNIKLIVKLHPSQTVKQTGEAHFSHLDVYTHAEFIENSLNFSQLLRKSDGLIGDYSSVSCQYLLLDKPQAFVIPDIEEYQKKRGFAFENPEAYMPGHIIKSKKEFYQFIDSFSMGQDEYKEERARVRDLFYTYQDNKNCERILKQVGLEC